MTWSIGFVGGVKCVVVGCVGLRKMLCRRFVAWCERFGSARAPQKGRDNTCVGRTRARTQTSDEDRPKRAALTLDRTQDQDVLKEQRNPQFSSAHIPTPTNAFSNLSFFTTNQPKQNTSTYQNFSRLQLKECLEGPANIPYCCPGSSTKALLLPSTPVQTTIFPESFRRISKEPCKIHRCSCTGHPKYEQNRTFRDTPLSPPGSKKHDRRPGFVSNPHPHRPQFFQTHFKEYPGNLQNTQVLLYSASKNLTK